jgi:hypothetical protein
MEFQDSMCAYHAGQCTDRIRASTESKKKYVVTTAIYPHQFFVELPEIIRNAIASGARQQLQGQKFFCTHTVIVYRNLLN